MEIKKGRIEACIATVPNEETGENCKIIGYFDSVASAMVSIIESNHPDYGVSI